MTSTSIYRDIAQRTGGDIYIGVVGPVRTGKSTFIKRFMETLVIPNINNVYSKERAKDELPQSGSGRTIMTSEPKFVPEDAVKISLGENADMSVRLIDCVGYMVDGANGHTEDGKIRMVTTPWFDKAIPMTQAAEEGTRKVITDHSTIGLVITTDGSVTEIAREGYLAAEERVIKELQQIKKPFSVIVNCENPNSQSAQDTKKYIKEKYGVDCIAVNCLELREEDIELILKDLLYSFPVTEIGVSLPAWVNALSNDHCIKKNIYSSLVSCGEKISTIKDVNAFALMLEENEYINASKVQRINLADGSATICVELPRNLFYETIGNESGFDIKDDGDLIELLSGLSAVKRKYERVSEALDQVNETGYGIVMPSMEEMTLENPEIIRHGGKYGVCLRASAPSIHMIKADIKTSVSPIVGTEQQSEDLINYMLSEFDDDPYKIWTSNIFGKSLNDLVSEGLNTKLKKMPDESRQKLRDTLQRIINEGSGGLICIIL